MVKRYILALSLLFGFTSALMAQQVSGGFHEAVIVTDNKVQWVETFERVAGWSLVDEGSVDAGWLKLWGVDDTARYSVVANTGAESGYIRFIQFDTIKAPRIRPNNQAWDVGGVFDLNLRVEDMAETRSALMAHGFSGGDDPVGFTFGPFEVKEWLPSGPDGVRFAIIERVKPTLEGWPNLKKLSRAFNSTMIVSNMIDARAFWEGFMGFKPYLLHRGASAKEGPNVFGMPHNWVTKIVRDVAILHPNGINEGSIELLTFEGLTGRDFSANTAMPNRGISRLRFPVTGLPALIEKAKSGGIKVIATGSDLPLSKVGRVDVAIIEAPGGAHIELFELLDNCQGTQ